MSKTRRVFVALWPPAGVRARLADVAAQLQALSSEARPVAERNLHLTLAFIGALDEQRVGELAEHVERCQIEPFVWQIDRVGSFTRARVLWAGGRRSAELERCARAVRALLDRCGIEYDHKPFVAHVTLVRDAKHIPANWPPLDPPIEWPCQRTTLVQSSSGASGPMYLPLTAV